MRRFTVLVSGYVVACLVLAAIIVLRGDGPHPRVISVYPPNADRFWPGGIAEITFSQSMDRASVQRALQVSIPGQGQEIWYGNSLNLQPLGDWLSGRTYQIRLVGKVTDSEGRPLETPFTYWFRVHAVGRLAYCRYRAIRNVCDNASGARRPITHSLYPVSSYALSADRTLLAYTALDPLGVGHLYIVSVDGTGGMQLTHGTAYSDSAPFWGAGESSSVSYYRRRVVRLRPHVVLGAPQLWNVNIDGSNNARLLQ